jgi:hypothetical protein
MLDSDAPSGGDLSRETARNPAKGTHMGPA